MERIVEDLGHIRAQIDDYPTTCVRYRFERVSLPDMLQKGAYHALMFTPIDGPMFESESDLWLRSIKRLIKACQDHLIKANGCLGNEHLQALIDQYIESGDNKKGFSVQLIAFIKMLQEEMK